MDWTGYTMTGFKQKKHVVGLFYYHTILLTIFYGIGVRGGPVDWIIVRQEISSCGSG